MKLHPKLAIFKGAKYIKIFNEILNGIEKDLGKLGTLDFEATITTYSESKSLLRRFFDPGYGDLEESLSISAHVFDCYTEIEVPMGKGGFTMPYLIRVMIPVSMTGWAEYRRGTFGGKWQLELEDKNRIADLKRVLPKVEMRHRSTSRTMPAQAIFDVKVGYFLAPTEDNKTEWVIHTAYEGGLLSGGSRPIIINYLEVIPAVEAMLRKWKKG